MVNLFFRTTFVARVIPHGIVAKISKSTILQTHVGFMCIFDMFELVWTYFPERNPDSKVHGAKMGHIWCLYNPWEMICTQWLQLFIHTSNSAMVYISHRIALLGYIEIQSSWRNAKIYVPFISFGDTKVVQMKSFLIGDKGLLCCIVKIRAADILLLFWRFRARDSAAIIFNQFFWINPPSARIGLIVCFE